MRDDRAATPAVGKALEAGLVVLYVGLLTTTLFGGYVPDYRSAAGDELADRTLATASHQVRAAVPPAARAAQVHARVDLPDTIKGSSYRIRADGRSLVLDHPDPGVGGRTQLALPDRVDDLGGTWHSQQPAAVQVGGTGGDLSVHLVAGDDAERGLPGGDSGEEGDGGDGDDECPDGLPPWVPHPCRDDPGGPGGPDGPGGPGGPGDPGDDDPSRPGGPGGPGRPGGPGGPGDGDGPSFPGSGNGSDDGDDVPGPPIGGGGP